MWAHLRTLDWPCWSRSSSAARIHRRTESGMAATPRATMALASSSLDSLANSSHTSSEVGHSSQPFWISFRASGSLPATSSCSRPQLDLAFLGGQRLLNTEAHTGPEGGLQGTGQGCNTGYRDLPHGR